VIASNIYGCQLAFCEETLQTKLSYSPVIVEGPLFPVLDLRKGHYHDYYVLGKVTQASECPAKVENVFKRRVIEHNIIFADQFSWNRFLEIQMNVR